MAKDIDTNEIITDDTRGAAVNMMDDKQATAGILNGIKHAEEALKPLVKPEPIKPVDTIEPVKSVKPKEDMTVPEVNKQVDSETFDTVELDGQFSEHYKEREMARIEAEFKEKFGIKEDNAPEDPAKTQEIQKEFLSQEDRGAIVDSMDEGQKTKIAADRLKAAEESLTGLIRQEDKPVDETPTEPEPTEEERTLWESAKLFMKELGPQAVGGIADMINNTWQTARDLGNAANLPDPFTLQVTNEKGEFDLDILNKEEVAAKGGLHGVIPTTDEAETKGGEAVRAITNFVSGFIPAAKALKGAGMASMAARGITGGAITGFTAMDPNQEGVSTLLNTLPTLQNPVLGYMADKNSDNNSVWELRIKNAIEEAAFGALSEAVVGSVVKVFKAFKAVKNAPKVAKTADQIATEEATAVVAKAKAIDEIAQPVKVDLGPKEIITKTPEGKTYLNLKRINTTEDVQKVLQNAADEVDLSKVTTNKETIERSSKEYTDLTDLLGREIDRPFTASEAVAARDIMTASAENLVELAKLANNPLTTNAENLFQFKKAMAAHADIQEVVLKGRKATAQSLQSWNVQSVGKERTAQIFDILNSPVGKDAKKVAEMVQDLAEKVGPSAVSRVAKDLKPGNKVFDSMYQVWINGLLSGPKTHLANITSNLATNIMTVPERFVTAGFDMMRGAGGESMAAARGRAAGFFGGIKDGFQLMAGKTKNEALQMGTKFDTGTGAISSVGMNIKNPNSVLGKGLDYLGAAIDRPGWALAKEDNFFKGWAYRMKVNENAYSTAYSEGLKGKAFKERVAELLKNPTTGMVDDAVEFARYQTFTNKPGESTAKFMLWQQSVPGARWITPFVKTPVNIFKYGAERTPLVNFALKDVRAAFAAGGTARSEVMARMAGGGVLMAGVAALTLDGSITGSGPTNAAARRALEQTGWQPYSIKVGDKYYSYQRIEPFAMLMGFAADVTSIAGQLEEAESDNVMVAGFAAISRNMMSKTYISGMTNLITAVASGEPTVIGNYMARQAASVAPAPYSSAAREINHYFDPIKKDYNFGHDKDMLGMSGFLRQMVERYKDNIPGWGSDAAPLRDVWGEEITYNHNVCPELAAISPINVKEVDHDPVNNMIADNGIALNLPGREVMGVRLNNEEYSRYAELAGKKAKEIVDRMYKGGSFKNLSDGPEGSKAVMVKRAITKGREFAAARLYREEPDFHDRVIQSKRDKAAALRGQR